MPVPSTPVNKQSSRGTKPRVPAAPPGYAAETSSSYKKVVAGPRLQSPPPTPRSPRSTVEATPAAAPQRLSVDSPDATPKARPVGSPPTRVEPFRFRTQEHASPGSPAGTGTPKPTTVGTPPVRNRPSLLERLVKKASPSPKETPKSQPTRGAAVPQTVRPARHADGSGPATPQASGSGRLPVLAKVTSPPYRSTGIRAPPAAHASPAQTHSVSTPAASSSRSRNAPAAHQPVTQPMGARSEHSAAPASDAPATATRLDSIGSVFAMRNPRPPVNRTPRADTKPNDHRTRAPKSTVLVDPTASGSTAAPESQPVGRGSMPPPATASRPLKTPPPPPTLIITLPTPEAPARRSQPQYPAAMAQGDVTPTTGRSEVPILDESTPGAATRRPSDRDITADNRGILVDKDVQLAGPGCQKNVNIPEEPGAHPKVDGANGPQAKDGSGPKAEKEASGTRVVAATAQIAAKPPADPSRGLRLSTSGSMPATVWEQFFLQKVAPLMRAKQKFPSGPRGSLVGNAAAEPDKEKNEEAGEPQKEGANTTEVPPGGWSQSPTQTPPQSPFQQLGTISLIGEPVTKPTEIVATERQRRAAQAAPWVADLASYREAKRKGKYRESRDRPEDDAEDDWAIFEQDPFPQLDEDGEWRPPSPAAVSVDHMYSTLPVFDCAWFDGLSKDSADYLIDLKGDSMDHAIDVRPYLIHIGQYARRQNFRTRYFNYEPIPPRDDKPKEEDDDVCVQAGKRYLLHRWKERCGYFMTPSPHFARLNKIWEVRTMPWAMYLVSRGIDEGPRGAEMDTGFSKDPAFSKINRSTRDDGTIFTNIRVPLVQRSFCAIDPVHHPLLWTRMILKQYHETHSPITKFNDGEHQTALEHDIFRFEKYMQHNATPLYGHLLNQMRRTQLELEKLDPWYAPWAEYWNKEVGVWHDGEGNLLLAKGEQLPPEEPRAMWAEVGHNLKTDSSYCS